MALEQDKSISVFINGKDIDVPVELLERGEEISFKTVVELAIGNELVPSGPNFEYRIKYSHAVARPPEGDLSTDKPVKIQKGTIFTVTYTDLS